MNAITKQRLTVKVRKEIGDLIARVGSLVRGDSTQRWIQPELPLVPQTTRRRLPRVVSRLERN